MRCIAVAVGRTVPAGEVLSRPPEDGPSSSSSAEEGRSLKGQMHPGTATPSDRRTRPSGLSPLSSVSASSLEATSSASSLASRASESCQYVRHGL